MNKDNQETFIYNRGKHDKFIQQLHPFMDSYTSEKEQIVLLRLVIDDNVDIAHLEKQDRFFFSVINDEMVSADYEFFSGVIQDNVDFNNRYYSPYAYGLVIENTEKISILIQKEGLFKESYKREIPCKLLKLDKNEDENIKFLEDGTYIIPAMTFFSASPFKKSGRTLIYNFNPPNQDEADKVKKLNKLVAKIKKLDIRNKYISPHVYQTSDSIYQCIEENNWNKLFPSKQFIGAVKIYNIGQGFCAHLREENGKRRILFDIGLDQRFSLTKKKSSSSYTLPDEQKEIIKENYSHIGKFKPPIIILSHWDIDHLLGICQMEGVYLPKVWIVPDMSERKSKPKFLLRVVAFLIYCKKMLIVGKQLNGQLFWQNDFISLYKGQTLASGRENANNNQGLIAVIRENIIFPGDCFYDAWPSNLAIAKRPYSFLIVPHHGGAAGILPEPKFSENCNADRPKVAIISYGKNNSYGHPKEEYLKKLKDEYGYSIQKTPNNLYIVIYINYNVNVKPLEFTSKAFLLEDEQHPGFRKVAEHVNLLLN